MHRDRFGYTLFLSISFHSIILIGLSLEISKRKIFSDINLISYPTGENFTVQLKSSPFQMDNQLNLDFTIAELKKKLIARGQDIRLRPRRDTITTVSAHKEQALYLKKWYERIEYVGNSNYPEEARKNRIFGSLRILVAIRADGHVEDFRIMESSGSPVLDAAAAEIIRLAAPFDPFPEEISLETDILEIVRTWRFHEGISLKAP